MASPRDSSAVYQNYIGGRWLPSSSVETFDNRNPANTDDLIGRVPRSNASDVEAAVAAARDAFPHWRLVPAPKRAEILYRAAQILADRKEDYARTMTRETLSSRTVRDTLHWAAHRVQTEPAVSTSHGRARKR